jgi:hemerythrin superfamily protein
VDIYSLIKKDHQEVASLFRRLKASEGFSETFEQLFAQLREDLELHAHAEERVLYSALKEAEGAQELVEEALDDHELVQNLLDELAAMRIDDEAWNEKLKVLEEHVEDHIEEEESDIFNVARQLFSVEQAAELAQRWQTAKQEHIWPGMPSRCQNKTVIRPRAAVHHSYGEHRFASDSRTAALPGPAVYLYPLTRGTRRRK